MMFVDCWLTCVAFVVDCLLVAVNCVLCVVCVVFLIHSCLLSGVRYLMLVACHLIRFNCRPLFVDCVSGCGLMAVTCCMLLVLWRLCCVDYCLSFGVFVGWLLSTVCCGCCCLRFVVCCFLRAVRCAFCAVCCSLCVVCLWCLCFVAFVVLCYVNIAGSLFVRCLRFVV